METSHWKVGDKVRLRGHKGMVGEILSINGSRVQIALINSDIQVNTNLAELVAIQNNTSHVPKKETVKEKVRLVNIEKASLLDFKPIVDLHGMRVQEALEAVGRLIDRSILNQRYQLKIIHGKGAGVLRKAVKEYLIAHEQVKEVKDAHPNPGGWGVTYAELW